MFSKLQLIFTVAFLSSVAASFAASDTGFDALSAEEKTLLKQHYDNVFALAQKIVNEVKLGDSDKAKENLKSCISEVMLVEKSYPTPDDRFNFGLMVGGVIEKFAQGDNKISTAIFEDFIAQLPKESLTGFDEGLRLVLLQNYYKLGRWKDGAMLVENTKTNGIVSGMFVREVAGFSSAMVTKAGLPKEGCVLYASLLESNVIPHSPSFLYGDALLNLSHIYASADNYSQQLEVLKSISYNDTNYFITNHANIAYFSYMASTSLHDKGNAMLSLVESAKAAKEHPEWVDDAIQGALTNAIEIYQKAGYIDGSLKLKFEPKLAENDGNGVKKWVRLVIFAFLFLSPLPVIYFLSRQNRSFR